MPELDLLQGSEWANPSPHLPTQADFDPHGGDLDAQHAWEHFGSLTLSQAYVRFCERPEVYQEDFMFMGGRAFAFYYPVIERFLVECAPVPEYDHGQAWILAKGIQLQFESRSVLAMDGLRSRVVELGKFVVSHLEKFATTNEERGKIQQAWSELSIVLERKKEV